MIDLGEQYRDTAPKQSHLVQILEWLQQIFWVSEFLVRIFTVCQLMKQSQLLLIIPWITKF